MIERYISRDAWCEAIRRTSERTDIPSDLVESWVKSPVSSEYLEGCVIGLLTYVTALLESKRTDPAYVHWLAQKTTSHLIFVLHKRGFKPYGDVEKDFFTPVNRFTTQEEIDQAVEKILMFMNEPPPEPGVKK